MWEPVEQRQWEEKRQRQLLPAVPADAAPSLAVLLGALGQASLSRERLAFRSGALLPDVWQAGAWCGGAEPAMVGAQHLQGPFRPRVSLCPSCERSTCPAWPHAPRGDLPGGVGRGNLVKLT